MLHLPVAKIAFLDEYGQRRVRHSIEDVADRLAAGLQHVQDLLLKL
jgi:hypothetical protein